MKTLTETLLLVLLTTGCATTRNYERTLATYVGHNIDEVVNLAGYPSQTFVAPNGNTVYLYQTFQQGVTPTVQGPSSTFVNGYGNAINANTVNGITYGGQPYTLYCNTYFEVNQENTIVNWRWQGNNCAQ